MSDPETQTATPEPAPTMEVPSVNPETPPVADSESQDTQWIDPMFRDQDAPLSDEPAGDEEAAEAAEGGEGDAGPSAEQLAELVAKDTEAPKSDKTAGKPVQPAAEAKEEPAEGDGSKASSKPADGGGAGSVSTDPKEEEEERINRRNRRERERAARIRTLETQVAGLEQRLHTPAAEAAAETKEVPAEPPTLEDHDFDTEKWTVAIGQWTKDTVGAADKKAEQTRQETANRTAAERQAETMEAFEIREKKATLKYKDYRDVVYDESLKIDPRAAQAIWQSEQGPEIAYYLATHQDESIAMHGMVDMDLGRALTKIEFTLSAEEAAQAEEANTAAAAAEEAPADKPGQQPKPAPTPTQAPPPVPTLDGSGAAMRPNPENMSMEEYAAGRLSGKIK